MACGILVPQPGIKPTLPALEAWSPNHFTTREVLLQSFEATALFWQPGSLLRRPVSSFPTFYRSLKGLLFVSRFWASVMVTDRSLVFLHSAGQSHGQPPQHLGTPSFSSGKSFYIISLILPLFHFLSVFFWCSGWSDVGPYILCFNFLSCLSCFHWFLHLHPLDSTELL